MSDFSNYRYPVARKQHKCEWCGESIPVGEKHFQFTGVWESEWQNWRMHQECYSQYIDDCNGEGFMPYENERPKAEVANV